MTVKLIFYKSSLLPFLETSTVLLYYSFLSTKKPLFSVHRIFHSNNCCSGSHKQFKTLFKDYYGESEDNFIKI